MGKITINRSVHLALRDKNYEEILGLLKYGFEGRALASRQRIISAISEKSKNSYTEALFARKGIVSGQRERDFIKFLRMFSRATSAVKDIVDQEKIMNKDTSFLKRFLSDSPELIGDFKISHRKHSRGIMKGLTIMARATESNFVRLKKDNYQTLTRDEQRRYKIMYSTERSIKTSAGNFF
jgi:hypothetical protein